MNSKQPIESSKEEKPVDQKQKRTWRYTLTLVILTVLILCNTFVILFGFLPAILPVFRFFSIPTPWHFYSGYGTPLGLTIWPGLFLAIICSIHIIICIRFRKVIEELLLKFLIVSVVVGGVCSLLIASFSDSQTDYVREIILQGLPDGMPIQVQASYHGGHLIVRISATTDTISVGEFEGFVADITHRTREASKRRRAELRVISIYLREPDGEELLMWRAPPLWAWEQGSYIGEYGTIDLYKLSPYLEKTNSHLYENISKASIQETIEAVVTANQFASELADEMNENIQTNVRTVVSFDDSRTYSIREVEAGKVRVDARVHETSLLTDVAVYVKEIDAQIRTVAQRHDLELFLSISLRPDDLRRRVEWESEASGDYGVFEVRGSDSRRFYIHINEIQDVIDVINEGLAQTMQEEDRISRAYRRVNNAFLTVSWVRADRKFMPLHVLFPETNNFEICAFLYLFLQLYENLTGNILPYETVVEYFSEEFEPDGELRLYDNGLHTEIQTFVEWALYVWPNKPSQEWRDYASEILVLWRSSLHQMRVLIYEDIEWEYSDYWISFLRESNYWPITLHSLCPQSLYIVARRELSTLSPQTLDILVRKEADPDYEIDWFGLQPPNL